MQIVQLFLYFYFWNFKSWTHRHRWPFILFSHHRFKQILGYNIYWILCYYVLRLHVIVYSLFNWLKHIFLYVCSPILRIISSCKTNIIAIPLILTVIRAIFYIDAFGMILILWFTLILYIFPIFFLAIIEIIFCTHFYSLLFFSFSNWNIFIIYF